MTLRNDLSSVIQHLTSKGYKIDTVFDIGANKGMWTAQYEQILHSAQFTLFEANPNHNRPSNLKQRHNWFNAVLSNPETSEADFYSIIGTGDSYYKERTSAYDNIKPLKLPTVTLDTMVKEHSLNLPQLMKLDTQGSELDILRGGSNVLNGTDIIVTEVAILPYNTGAPCFDDYIKFLDGLGFVPMGLEGFHFVDNMLAQLDVVFLKQNIKTKYYGNQKFFEK